MEMEITETDITSSEISDSYTADIHVESDNLDAAMYPQCSIFSKGDCLPLQKQNEHGIRRKQTSKNCFRDTSACHSVELHLVNKESHTSHCILSLKKSTLALEDRSDDSSDDTLDLNDSLDWTVSDHLENQQEDKMQFVSNYRNNCAFESKSTCMNLNRLNSNLQDQYLNDISYYDIPKYPEKRALEYCTIPKRLDFATHDFTRQSCMICGISGRNDACTKSTKCSSCNENTSCKLVDMRRSCVEDDFLNENWNLSNAPQTEGYEKNHIDTKTRYNSYHNDALPIGNRRMLNQNDNQGGESKCFPYQNECHVSKPSFDCAILNEGDTCTYDARTPQRDNMKIHDHNRMLHEHVENSNFVDPHCNENRNSGYRYNMAPMQQKEEEFSSRIPGWPPRYADAMSLDEIKNKLTNIIDRSTAYSCNNSKIYKTVNPTKAKHIDQDEYKMPRKSTNKVKHKSFADGPFSTNQLELKTRYNTDPQVKCYDNSGQKISDYAERRSKFCLKDCTFEVDLKDNTKRQNKRVDSNQTNRTDRNTYGGQNISKGGNIGDLEASPLLDLSYTSQSKVNYENTWPKFCLNDGKAMYVKDKPKYDISRTGDMLPCNSQISVVQKQKIESVKPGNSSIIDLEKEIFSEELKQRSLQFSRKKLDKSGIMFEKEMRNSDAGDPFVSVPKDNKSKTNSSTEKKENKVLNESEKLGSLNSVTSVKNSILLSNKLTDHRGSEDSGTLMSSKSSRKSQFRFVMESPKAHSTDNAHTTKDISEVTSSFQDDEACNSKCPNKTQLTQMPFKLKALHFDSEGSSRYDDTSTVCVPTSSFNHTNQKSSKSLQEETYTENGNQIDNQQTTKHVKTNMKLIHENCTFVNAQKDAFTEMSPHHSFESQGRILMDDLKSEYAEKMFNSSDVNPKIKCLNNDEENEILRCHEEQETKHEVKQTNRESSMVQTCDDMNQERSTKTDRIEDQTKYQEMTVATSRNDNDVNKGRISVENTLNNSIDFYIRNGLNKYAQPIFVKQIECPNNFSLGIRVPSDENENIASVIETKEIEGTTIDVFDNSSHHLVSTEIKSVPLPQYSVLTQQKQINYHSVPTQSSCSNQNAQHGNTMWQMTDVSGDGKSGHTIFYCNTRPTSEKSTQDSPRFEELNVDCDDVSLHLCTQSNQTNRYDEESAGKLNSSSSRASKIYQEFVSKSTLHSSTQTDMCDSIMKKRAKDKIPERRKGITITDKEEGEYDQCTQMSVDDLLMNNVTISTNTDDHQNVPAEELEERRTQRNLAQSSEGILKDINKKSLDHSFLISKGSRSRKYPHLNISNVEHLCIPGGTTDLVSVHNKDHSAAVEKETYQIPTPHSYRSQEIKKDRRIRFLLEDEDNCDVSTVPKEIAVQHEARNCSPIEIENISSKIRPDTSETDKSQPQSRGNNKVKVGSNSSFFKCSTCNRAIPKSMDTSCELLSCNAKKSCGQVFHGTADLMMHLTIRHNSEVEKFVLCHRCNLVLPDYFFNLRNENENICVACKKKDCVLKVDEQQPYLIQETNTNALPDYQYEWDEFINGINKLPYDNRCVTDYQRCCSKVNDKQVRQGIISKSNEPSLYQGSTGKCVSQQCFLQSNYNNKQKVDNFTSAKNNLNFQQYNSNNDLNKRKDLKIKSKNFIPVKPVPKNDLNEFSINRVNKLIENLSKAGHVRVIRKSKQPIQPERERNLPLDSGNSRQTKRIRKRRKRRSPNSVKHQYAKEEAEVKTRENKGFNTEMKVTNQNRKCMKKRSNILFKASVIKGMIIFSRIHNNTQENPSCTPNNVKKTKIPKSKGISTDNETIRNKQAIHPKNRRVKLSKQCTLKLDKRYLLETQ